MSDTVQTIPFQIGNGTIALPTFQRGYVWNREQVRGLMQSVYRRYPIGSLLVWKTEIDPAYVKAGGGNAIGTVHLLLDGQQRMTTLFGIVYGSAPPFFEGDTKVFTGLHFHLEDEVFEFYAPVKMRHPGHARGPKSAGHSRTVDLRGVSDPTPPGRGRTPGPDAPGPPHPSERDHHHQDPGELRLQLQSHHQPPAGVRPGDLSVYSPASQSLDLWADRGGEEPSGASRGP
jgi:hypothetical protein